MKTTALIICTHCATTNRIPLGVKVRCAKCKHVFTPLELTRAKVEAPPRIADDFDLEQEDDVTWYRCKDEDNCGWDGSEDDVDYDDNDKPICPDCGKRVKHDDDQG